MVLIMADRVVKPKPPRIPRCLCRNTLHWLLQIGSPSLYNNALLSRNNSAAEVYFTKLRVYWRSYIEWKIHNRTCTRTEWARYRQIRRLED